MRWFSAELGARVASAALAAGIATVVAPWRATEPGPAPTATTPTALTSATPAAPMSAWASTGAVPDRGDIDGVHGAARPPTISSAGASAGSTAPSAAVGTSPQTLHRRVMTTATREIAVPASSSAAAAGAAQRAGAAPHPRSGAASTSATTAALEIGQNRWLVPGPAASGGVVLDEHGGLHPFGGLSLDTAGAPSWPGVDAARAVQIRADGSGGWEMSAYGGIYAFGAASQVTSPVAFGQPIARAFVITSLGPDGYIDGRQGYVLDAYGGIHPWGGAPSLPSPVHFGADQARGLDVHYTCITSPRSSNPAIRCPIALGASIAGQRIPDGVTVLDSDGYMHTAGGTDNSPGPAPHVGHDIYEALHRELGPDAYTYSVARYGIVQGLQGGFTPSWSGYSDFGGQDVLRDIMLAAAEGGTATAQPVSPDAMDAFGLATVDLHTVSNWVPVVRQDRALDCEAAATASALQGAGAGVSQDWVQSQFPVDSRPAVTSGGRVVEWGDPYADFVGNVDGSQANLTGYGIYYPWVVTAAQRAGHRALGGQGWSTHDIFGHLDLGHRVVIWTDVNFDGAPASSYTAFDGRVVPFKYGEHAVTLYGVDFGAGTVSVMDDAEGVDRTFSISQFQSLWSTFGEMAVVVE